MRQASKKLMAALLVLALILCGKAWANPVKAQAAKKVLYYRVEGGTCVFGPDKDKRQMKKEARKLKIGLITKAVIKKNKLILYGSLNRSVKEFSEKRKYLKHKKRVFKMAKNVKYYCYGDDDNLHKENKKSGEKYFLKGNYPSAIIKTVNGKVTRIVFVP